MGPRLWDRVFPTACTTTGGDATACTTTGGNATGVNATACTTTGGDVAVLFLLTLCCW